MANQVEVKNVSTAGLLSLLFTGLGHFYLGRVGRGFMWLGLAFVAAFVVYSIFGTPVFGALPIWIWAIIDATQIAQQMNEAAAKEAEQGTKHREKDNVELLTKLADLRDRGVITKTEFEAKKKKLLAESK